MDFFVVLALLALAIPLCAIAGLVIAVNLRRRVQDLEARLASAEGRLKVLARGTSAPTEAAPPPPAVSAGTPAQEAPAPEPVPEPPRSAVPAVPPSEASDHPAPASAGATRGLEEQLGARWAVWIGGLALGLGGIFLVRYSIEQGLLGPGARIAAGALFALALIGAGEWLRRRETAFAIGGFPSAHIPGVLTGAGTLTAFATIYAAHALYGMIGPTVTFGALGAVALLAMVASALHGPNLAALGLLGALVTPLLVSSNDPRVWPVVLYLGFAVAAAYGVARLRLWPWLARAAAVGALLWGLLFLAVSSEDLGPVTAHILLQAVLAGLFLVAEPYRRTADGEAAPDSPASLALLGFAALTILVAADPLAGSLRPLFSGAMTALLVALAIRFAPVAAAAFWAGAIAVGTLLLWPVAAEVAAEPATVLPGPFGLPERPAAVVAFLTFGGIAALGVAALSLWRVARAGPLRTDLLAWYLAAAALTPLATLVVAYGRVTAFDRSISFALVAGAMAAGFAGAARWLDSRPGQGDPMRLPAGATASAALAALALGLTFALDKGMLTVAFALTALGTAVVAWRTGVPALRYAVGAAGLLVLGRLAWNPNVVPGSPGEWPILNWLLWGYGVPAASFWLAARLLARDGPDRVTRFVESLAILFAALLVFFEIRHAIHGDIASPAFDHLEAGLMTTASLAFATVLARIDLARGDPVYRIGTSLFSGIALLVAALGLLLVTNPLFSGEAVRGGPVLNSLLAAYLLPAVLAGALAIFARRGNRPRPYVWGVATLALVLHLTWLVLAIRRLFHGPEVGLDLPTGEAEQWCYSLALLACGLTLLVLGASTRSRYLRLASLAYLALAVLKVFIIDLSSLEGIMRALSFIGLGLTLIGIAFVYQRLLARRPAATGA